VWLAGPDHRQHWRPGRYPENPEALGTGSARWSTEPLAACGTARPANDTLLISTTPNTRFGERRAWPGLESDRRVDAMSIKQRTTYEPRGHGEYYRSLSIHFWACQNVLSGDAREGL